MGKTAGYGTSTASATGPERERRVISKLGRVSRQLQHEIERRDLPASFFDYLHDERLLEEVVPLVAWLVREVQLGSEDALLGRLDLDMDVPGAARVLARKNALQLVATFVVGELMAAVLEAIVVIVTGPVA